jgi:glycosyltransferase involved in cell wall biosynthesis
LNICVINSVFPPFDSRLFHREIMSLVRAGHQVTLIGPHLQREEFVRGVRLLGFPRMTALPLRPLNWVRILARLRQVDADAYHFHDPELLPMALGLAWGTRRPVVYDCFEHYPRAIMSDERIPQLARPLFSQAFGFLESKIAEQLAAVIVLGVYARDDRRFDGVRRLVLARNVPSRGMFETVPWQGPRQRQLVYIGDISESRRGISTLIAMLSLMRNQDVSLLLIGKVDTRDTRARLDELIAGLHLRERVSFLPEVSYECIPSYLVASAVGLIPMKSVLRWEYDVPQKTFEYMACGLPFVASDLSSTRRFVTDTNAGITVESQSPQSFAAAVDYLLDHPEAARRLGENGRQAFLREYNWETESQALIDLYASLAAGR